jgi:DNA-binding cell septation regulator SpoVG
MTAPNAAIAAAFGDRPSPKRMRLLSFKPMVKGALRGFATVQLPIGLTIEDCPVLVGRNGAWAALPSRPVLDGEGRQAKPDGKAQFASILKWRDRDLQDRFSQAVVDLVRQHHPAALDGNEP